MNGGKLHLQLVGFLPVTHSGRTYALALNDAGKPGKRNKTNETSVLHVSHCHPLVSHFHHVSTLARGLLL
ncbi:hypothetical protein HMPREF9944_01100 [Segatella maculosa OT 289]|uniref:Uncharacterized protein n=1 Tax=Segatella maculosa OT 289 TaxID=999422 RepID=H1HLQ6_9BACT|nr:hypothetical protein HMPREF9944_01100 [Segatella maculosa OT 289]